MGKRTKKLLVYLDQNFLSEMSKAGVNENVRPEFTDIYELLHQGFLDEKVVVPSSMLHEIESSLATHLKDRISTYQHYLGQVRLRRPNEIENLQTDGALQRFRGRDTKDPLDPQIAFLDDPDRRVERFGIHVDAHWEQYGFRQSRQSGSQELEELRQGKIRDGVTYNRQVEYERNTQRQAVIDFYHRYGGSISEETARELAAFVTSPDFNAIPLLKIEAHLYAAILTRYPERQIKSSDTTDIEVLSAYLPYMDLVCTDAFMAEQLRGFAGEYGVHLFSARTASLRELKTLLETVLGSAQPIRRPSISAFVLPPKEGRDQSFQFFKQLGEALRRMGLEEYGDLYAFDDGAMPKYELSSLPGHPVPFYGLQDVTSIPINPGTNEEEILNLCRARCRADHFVLIDDYKEIPNTFMIGAAMHAEANEDTISGYRIFKVGS